MRIGKIIKKSRYVDEPATRKVGGEEPRNSILEEFAIEVNGKKIFSFLVSAGFVTAMLALGTFWLINKPNNDAILKQYQQAQEILLLNMVLRDTLPDNRRKSVHLLVKAGFLSEPKDSTLLKLNEDNLPNWKDLDTLVLFNHKPELVDIELLDISDKN